MERPMCSNRVARMVPWLIAAVLAATPLLGLPLRATRAAGRPLS